MKKEKSMLRRKTFAALVGLVGLLAASTSAWATTAANTQIVNTATLTFNGGSKNASVTVAVNLVPAQPTVLLNGATGGYTGVNTPVLADSLVLTSNANGPATYHVTAAIGSGAQAPVNATGSTVVDGGGFDVTLGASVTTVGASNQSGGNTLVIPAPDAAHVTGSGATLTVNGIAANSTITFSTFTRTVSSIALNGDGTYTITFNGSAITPVAAGTPVYEQKTVAGITALPGTVATLGSDIHVYAQALVTTGGVGQTASAWADNKWTTASPNVALTKYVRNLTTSASNPSTGGTTFTVNGTSSAYFTTGVTGKQDDVLEYVLFASNTSTTDDLTGTSLSDALPTSYVNVITGAYGGGGADVFYSPSGNGTGSALAIGAAGTSQAYSSANANSSITTLTVNVGSGAGVSSTGTIGKEVGGVPTSVFIAYRVKIK
jgi:hypothetical protein